MTDQSGSDEVRERWTLIERLRDGQRVDVTDEVLTLIAENERLREAGDAVISAWDAMDGSEVSRGALMGAFGALRLELVGLASDEDQP